jgi:phosphomannomutase
MLELLRELRKKTAIGFVGGSDLVKITEQLGVHGSSRTYVLVILNIEPDIC